MLSTYAQNSIYQLAHELTTAEQPLGPTDPERGNRVREELVKLSGAKAISTSIGLSIPSPEVSFALLENLMEMSVAVGKLAAKLTVEDEIGCWSLPLAAEYDSKKRARYPVVTRKEDGAKSVIAHRYMWRVLVDPHIPTEHHLDHLCRTHACCNITHLEPVQAGLNTKRGNLARRIESGEVPLF